MREPLLFGLFFFEIGICQKAYYSLAGNDTDKYTAIVCHGDKVLFRHAGEKLFHGSIDIYGRIPIRTDNIAYTDPFGFQTAARKKIAENIALRDRPDIFARR